jgi:hypothetical protein
MRRATFLLILVGGCGTMDPHARSGSWRPLNSNEANLRLHVADPAVLERGRGDPRADGRATAAAVERYRTGRVRALPASGIARVQATGSGAGGEGASPMAGGDGGR